MAINENLSLQLELASAQIITTVLVTLGATLFAISVGIQLTLPPIVEDVIDQLMTERMIVSDIQHNVVQQALDNYIFLLTGIGALDLGRNHLWVCKNRQDTKEDDKNSKRRRYLIAFE
jgi:hypothetical protein